MGITINYGFDRRAFLFSKVAQFKTKNIENIQLPKEDNLNSEERLKRMNSHLDAIIDRMYSQLLTEIEKMSGTYSEMDITEMKRLLKECYNKFKKEDFRAKVKNMSSKRIAQELGEELLGISKRKYDMSNLYCEGLIADKKYSDGSTKKMVGLKPLDSNDDRTIICVNDEANVKIQQVGTLLYSDGITGIDNVGQYKVEIPIRNGKQKEYVVFSKIDFDLLASDANYQEAVFGELLSGSNIELSNAGGYIGEIVYSTGMEPGNERKDENGFYTYQISDSYALSVDSMAVTAAKIWDARQKDKQQEQPL